MKTLVSRCFPSGSSRGDDKLPLAPLQASFAQVSTASTRRRRAHWTSRVVVATALFFLATMATGAAAQSGVGCGPDGANILPSVAPSHVVTNFPNLGSSGAAGIPQDGMPYYFAPGVLPTYNAYPASSYSTVQISPAAVRPRLKDLCALSALGPFASGAVPFSFYNWDPAGAWVGQVLAEPVVPGWSGPGTGRVRVIHGLVIDDSFVTVLLPPNWTYGAGNHPLVFEAFYDVNKNLFNDFGHSGLIASIVAKSGLLGRQGSIGVLWNTGSSEVGVGGNSRALAQFTSVLGWVASHLKGDPFRVHMVGRSRGGTVPLILASSGSAAFTIKYIVSIAAGTKFGEHLSISGATMLGQVGGANGRNDSWMPGWTYSDANALFGLSSKEASSQIMFGTNVASLDSIVSPIAPARLTNIKAKGTKILMLVGTNDRYIPYGTQMEYIQAMQDPASPAPLEAHVVIGGGHLRDADAMDNLLNGAGAAFNAGDRLLNAVMFSMGAGGTDAVTSTGPNRIRYYRATKGTTEGAQSYTALSINASSERPFTVEVPYRVWTGMPVEMFVAGHPGTLVELWTNVSGPLGTFTIPPSGSLYFTANSAGWPPIGTLLYGVAIKTPSMGAFQTISSVGSGAISGVTEMFPQCGSTVLGTIIDPSGPPYITAYAAVQALDSRFQPPNRTCINSGAWSETNWGLAKVVYP